MNYNKYWYDLLNYDEFTIGPFNVEVLMELLCFGGHPKRHYISDMKGETTHEFFTLSSPVHRPV